jgi:hypothetical protein
LIELFQLVAFAIGVGAALKAGKALLGSSKSLSKFKKRPTGE